ncbi:MAG: DNA primase [Chloroflexota bacterium]
MADSAIEEIKRRVDIVDLVGQSVALKRAGRSFKGLCPFHNEKTPSFNVWPERGLWRCFGCGESGDAFSFVMRRENLEFVEALRVLANRAGVELAQAPRPDPRAKEAEARLTMALESTGLYYRGMLHQPAGAHALAYLRQRGLTDPTIEQFALGFAHPRGAGLVQHLAQAGFSEDEMVTSGAVGRSDEGQLYDRFRGRVIFPIRDVEGHVIGFGGRALAADQQPKYLNTPQTELFDKGGSLYALDQARQAIRESHRAIVVEGYMDVLAAHQSGFKNVVATLGTAIGERHVDTLRRLAPEIVLALDDDAAGTRAAIRGSEIASEATADESPTIMRVRGLGRFFADRRTQVKVMVLSGGRDPDDLIREDPELWKRLTADALPAIEFVLRGVGDRHDLSTTEGRRSGAREVMAIIQDLPDPVERAHYIQRLARVLDTREEFLLQAAETRPRRHTPPAGAAAPPLPAQSFDERLESLVIALLLRVEGPRVLVEPALFEHPLLRLLVERLEGMAEWPDLETALDRLAGDLGEIAVPNIRTIAALAEEASRLSQPDLQKELQIRVLELRKLSLFRQHQALDSLLREEDAQLEGEERRAYHERLNTVASRLGSIFAEQRNLGVVGTASWSIRRGQEMLADVGAGRDARLD